MGPISHYEDDMASTERETQRIRTPILRPTCLRIRFWTIQGLWLRIIVFGIPTAEHTEDEVQLTAPISMHYEDGFLESRGIGLSNKLVLDH